MHEKKEETLSWSCWLRTLFFNSGAVMLFVFDGLSEGQSAVLLPQLHQVDSIIHTTPEEDTWIASLGILLTPVSALLIGPFVDAFGRKPGLLSFYILMGVGFGIIAVATEVWHIYVGRCVCSFALGLEVVAVVYLAESSAKEQRSLLLSTIGGAFTIGVALTYLVGGYLPWNIASAVISLSCFAYLLVQLLTPESPAWLFKHGDVDASIRSLEKLGRRPSGIKQELELLRLSSKDQSEKIKLRTFLEPTVWKPFVLLSLYHIILCGSGFYHNVFYTIDFVEQLGTSYNSLTVTLIISIVRVVAGCTVGVYFTSYVSRRLATVLSAIGMTLTLLGAGIYEYLFRDTPVGQKPYEWIPVLLLIAKIVTGIAGVTALPWVMSGEVFPLRVRGSMSGLVFVVGTGASFFFIKSYSFLLEVFKIWGLLFAFAAVSFLGVFYGAFMLPETQNKSLYEIEQSFIPKEKKAIFEAPNLNGSNGGAVP